MRTVRDHALEAPNAESDHRSTEILGIDLAPSKPTVVWSESGVERLPPGEVRGFLERRLASRSRLLVTWDSPLAFDPVSGFSDRAIDRATRAWVSRMVKTGRIEKGAVSVRPFSGCPHWALSCHALGLPFGQAPQGFRVSPSTYRPPPIGAVWVIESHPAVALAVWWVSSGISEAFPLYKGGKAKPNSASIVAEKLGFPAAAGRDDDVLDAYVGWGLGRDFADRTAVLVGEPAQGGYLLPENAATTEILESLPVRSR